MRNAAFVAAAVIVAASGLAGCGAVAESARPPASSATAAAAPASPSPAVDEAALQRQASAGAIPPGGLSSLGVKAKPKEEDTGKIALTAVCNQRVDTPSGVHLSQLRTWTDQGYWVRNTVHAYATSTGEFALSLAREAAETCKSYTDQIGEHTLLGPVQLPEYPGIEASYAYCDSIERADNGKTYVSCMAFLASRNLVAYLWVVHGSSRKTNTDGIVAVSRLAAEALHKAPGPGQA